MVHFVRPPLHSGVPCPRLSVGMLAAKSHAHAEPWAWHTKAGRDGRAIWVPGREVGMDGRRRNQIGVQETLQGDLA
jgi:hypothetical protein